MSYWSPRRDRIIVSLLGNRGRRNRVMKVYSIPFFLAFSLQLYRELILFIFLYVFYAWKMQIDFTFFRGVFLIPLIPIRL